MWAAAGFGIIMLRSVQQRDNDETSINMRFRACAQSIDVKVAKDTTTH